MSDKPIFKNDKQKTKRELPKNNRFIPESTEKLSQKKSKTNARGSLLMLIGILIGVGALSGISFFSPQIMRYYRQFDLLEQERRNITSQVAQWEETAVLHPGSPDIYLRLAGFSYQLGDRQKAWAFVQRALVLNPNYEPARKWEQILSGK